MDRKLLHVTSLIILCLSSCVSSPPPLTKQTIEFVFTSSRYLELEPCGCQLRQLGGLEREWNAIEERKPQSERILATAGTMFLPTLTDFKPTKLDFYARKSAFLIEGLRAIGIEFLSPSLDDFALGLEKIQALSEGASLRFLSANLYHSQTKKPLFRRYWEVERNGLLLVGMASPKTTYPLKTAVEAQPPAEALGSLLNEVGRKRFIIILSNLDREERERLRAEYPEVRLFLGGNDEESTFNVDQLDGTTLYVNPPSRGRSLHFLTLHSTDPTKPFFNPQSSATLKDARRSWQSQIDDHTEKLKKVHKKSAEGTKLEKSREELSSLLERTASIPLEEPLQSILYEGAPVALEKEYDVPKNRLSPIVERYKANLRELALEERPK